MHINSLNCKVALAIWTAYLTFLSQGYDHPCKFIATQGKLLSQGTILNLFNYFLIGT